MRVQVYHFVGASGGMPKVRYDYGMTLRILRLPFITGVLCVLLLALFTVSAGGFSGDTGLLRVTFLDVGQGDATLIESPTGTQVLIDGGKGSAVLAPLARELGFFDRDIDMLVATHPDADHIGGLIDVLERYTVHTILMTENVNDTPVYDLFQERARAEGARIIMARSGQVYDLGDGRAGSTTLTILFPDHDPTNLESNMSSIVSRLVYGESEYLLTGDSPQEIEEYLVSKGIVLESDILKVGHHGSRTSSAESFITTVNPETAVISAGNDNSYGHPHKEVMDLLSAHHIQTKNTADFGSIISVSDGKQIFFK